MLLLTSLLQRAIERSLLGEVQQSGGTDHHELNHTDDFRKALLVLDHSR